MAKHLTVADAQKRINPLPAAMSAKGLREPTAELTIAANGELRGYMNWKDKRKPYGSSYEFIRGKSAADVLAKMEAFIAKLPSPDETRMKEFMTALSDVIELGRQNGIAVEFINPLTEAMHAALQQHPDRSEGSLMDLIRRALILWRAWRARKVFAPQMAAIKSAIRPSPQASQAAQGTPAPSQGSNPRASAR